MNRGELYRVTKPRDDPKLQRVYVIVSRQKLIESRHSSVVCAPILTNGEGLATQVAVGPENGLKHQSWVTCDGLVSLCKSLLTNYVGTLSVTQLKQLNHSLAMALDLPIEVQ
jgi:mRNA interferase MazF